MRNPTNVLATSLLLVLALAGSMPAQQSATLDQVEKLISTDRLAQARTALAQWQKQHAKPSDEDSWRATYLAARLATDAHEAEEGYLSIAISAPASNRYVPESLLRVGQAEMLAGSARNGAPYLKRLIDNYPKSEYAATAAEWLQRTRVADAVVHAPVSAAPVRAPVSATPAAPAKPAAGNWTIQVAAFHEMSGAQSVARQVQAKGFGAVRVARVPDNGLLRVRVGSFNSAAAAAETVAKLKRAGFSAVIVSDAARETRVQ